MQFPRMLNSSLEVFQKDQKKVSGKGGGILFILKLILGLFLVLQRWGAFFVNKRLRRLTGLVAALSIFVGMDVVANPVQDVYHYHYTGGIQTFTVPAGVTSISVDAYGASGTTIDPSRGNYDSQLGKGGRVQANLTVTPGDTLYLYVGEAPHYLGYGIQPGGWNGGGDGPNTGNAGVGFPGGGATDIRIGGTGLNNRVIVAGGGGGKANGITDGGGHGGGLVGQNGGGGSNSGGPRYGAGGSQSSGGAGGYAWYGDGTPTYTIVPSSNGQLGQGGTGDTNSGGGGGGYYGGGGGADAGGGGGSSYTDPTLSSSVVHTQGVQTGSGQLTITVTQGDGPDAIRPVITVTSGVDTVLQGSTWTDAGATADTGETVTVVSNTVNTSAAGIYTVTYSATDTAGNVGTATRIVTVDLDTLNADGTAVQWAHTTANNDGIHYDLAQPLELIAPPGYTVVLKNATRNYEYNTGLEFVSDVEALLVSAGDMNGRGYGGLLYRYGTTGNWDHSTNSYVAFARPLPDTTAPVITSGGVGIGLFENSGTGQSVYTIAASDAIGVVSYAIGGTDAASLTVNQTTGVVTFNADPDYEAKNSYSFTVTASDAAGNTSDPTTVTFSIADVDEIPPVITSGATGINLVENSGSGQTVYTITASDANGVVSYAIGGTDAASLTLTGNDVSLIADPDYETKNSYSFTVTASDDAGNTSDPTTVTFSISNVDEVVPTITSGAIGINLAENSGAGQAVYTIAAAANDGGTLQGYAIAGTDAASLSVNSGTGVVTLNADPDYETKSSYSFDVTATDAGGTSAATTVTFSISNVDEVVPTITSGAIGINLAENSGAGQAVYTITAAANDGGTVQGYAIAGTDAASLSVNSGTGVVTLIADPDYETKSSYSFNVTATDAGGISAATTVTFSITDVDEIPTVKNAYSIQIDANTNIALDSTVGEVGGLWSFYSNGVASDPSNSLSVFLEGVRDATTHKMSHSASDPGSLSQTSGTGTNEYNFTGIPGSGNDDSAKGVVLKYTAIEERELLIETTGGAYNDSVVVIFTEAHLNGGSAPFRVVTMDNGDPTTFKVKFPYFPDNSDANIYYIAFTSYNSSDLGSGTPLKITAPEPEPEPEPVAAGSYLLVNTVDPSGNYDYDTVMAGFVDSTSPSLKSDDIDNDADDYGTPQVWSKYGDLYGNYPLEMSALDVNVNDVPVDGYFRVIVSHYGYNPGGGGGDGGGDGSGDGDGDGSGGGGLSLVTYNQEQNEPPSSGYLDGLTLNFGVEVFGADTTRLNVDPVELTHQIVLDASQIKDFTIVDIKLNQNKTAVSEVRYNKSTWINLSNNEEVEDGFGDVVVYTNNSTTLTGQVTIEGEPADSGDVVAIYVGSELRAKQEVIINGGVAWLSALVNTAGVNEAISFKVYDASTGVTHEKSRTSAVITTGGVVGSFSNPLMIEMRDFETQTLNLKAGWNLVSFFVEADDMTAATVLAPIEDKLLHIKSLTEFYDPSVAPTFNSLSSLSVNDGYWLKVSEDVSLNVEGPVPSGASISVKRDWNLVGYPRLIGENVASELTSLDPTVVQIKNLESLYDPSNPSFLNTLSTMVPGSGYWLNVTQDGTWELGSVVENSELNFAHVKTRSDHSSDEKVGPVWGQAVVYPNLGATVLAKVSIQGKPVAKGGVVAAFVGNELRGLQDVVLDNGFSYVTLNVNLNEAEEVSYRVWNPHDHSEYLVSGTMLLELGGMYGNPELVELNAVELVNKPLQVFDVTREPFGFSFNTMAGRNYTVEATGDLRTWEAVELFQGSGGEIRFTAKPTFSGEARFFRVYVK